MQVTASRSDAITQRRTSPRIQTPPPPPPVSEPAQRSIAVRDEAFAFPEHELLMSTTDRTGRITHCNAAFCHVSGYSMDELMGQPHNMVRHPDMPAEAFKDMWATIGHGRTWTGLVKNLRKDGRYYWVRAYVTPIMEGGKPRGYMSVRVKPTDGEVRAATTLYARFRQGTQGSLYLHAGHVRRRGLFQHFNQLQRANFTQRLLGLLTPLLLVALLFPAMGWTQGWQIGLQAMLLAALTGLVLYRQHLRITQPFEAAVSLCSDIAGCKLDGALPAYQGRHPMGFLLERLKQVQTNLRAVVGDARHEIDGFSSLAGQIEQSARHMQQASQTIQQVVASVTDVSQLLQDVTTAADAQSQGIAQVNDALHDLDTVTQANAQLAEVSAQSAHHMDAHAGILRRTLDIFRL